MLAGYIRLAFRRLIRDPFFTLINVTGLSVGLACFLALSHFSLTELRSDRHHRDWQRTARICLDWQWTDDGGETWGQSLTGMSSPATALRLAKDFPEVEDVVRIYPQMLFDGKMAPVGPDILLSTQSEHGREITIKETKLAYSDPNLFEFFNIPLIHGNSSTVLRENNAVVLSESTARKYYGNVNPVGELLRMNDTLILKVTGVFRDHPANTHLDFEVVLSNGAVVDKWNANPWQVTANYVKLAGSGFSSFETRVNESMPEYFAPVVRVFPNVRGKLIAQPLADVAFESNYFNTFRTKSRSTLRILGILSVVVLLVAWINCLNLIIARTSKRFKEIGTRKISGAGIGDLSRQFLTEACALYVIAVLLAFTLLQLTRTPAELYLGIHVPALPDIAPGVILFLCIVLLLGILLIGLYPALMCNSFSPRDLFLISKPGGSRLFSSVLTTAQYAIAIALVFYSMTTYRQLDFLLSKDLGIDGRGVFIIDAPVVRPPEYANSLINFTRELESIPSVTGVTGASKWNDLRVQRMNDASFVHVDAFGVTETYLPFYNLKLLAGRNFLVDDRADVVILSRYCAERLGYRSPSEAIGARLHVSIREQSAEMEIVGVIENFRVTPFFRSANTEAETGRGFAFTHRNKTFTGFEPDAVAVRLDAGTYTGTLTAVEAKFNEVFPGNVFSGNYFSDFIARPYADEKRTRNQLIFFTSLAIGIACLGLLGMVANRVVEKTRELAIRKVLGGGVGSLTRVLFSSTINQIALAMLFGFPVATYISLQYLERYSERILFNVVDYLLPAGMLLTILFFSVGALVWQAVVRNPVEALKHE